jgi:hypothetical protein
MNVFSSSRLRCAVVVKTRSELRISPASCPWRSLSAWNTVPPLANSWLTAPLWVSSTRSSWSAWVKVGSSSPNACDSAEPWPLRAIDAFCIHCSKAIRVFGLKVRKISSSCTAWETWPLGNVPPSGNLGPFGPAGVSST